MNNTPSLIEAIAAVEAAHFRTVDDTGAHPCAMTIMHCLRNQAGLPYLTKDDLPKWDHGVKAYVKPANSRLLTIVDNQSLIEAEETKRGQTIIDTLGLLPSDVKGYYRTAWGRKTPLGVYRMMSNLVNHGE